MKARKDQFIIVTGGTKGIGKAVIEVFMEVGFNVITCSRNENDLVQLKNDLSQRFPNQKVYVQKADLSDKDSCKSFSKFIAEIGEKIDILVNNAGYFIQGQIHTEEEGVLESMINTNLYSAYHLSRVVIPLMKTVKAGHIFNICSTASITPYVNGGSYCISKYALLGMTKVLREEMKDFNIRVSAILPGATLTSSWDGVELPESRFIKPNDIAMAILSSWKLSDYAVVEEIIIRPQLGDI